MNLSVLSFTKVNFRSALLSNLKSTNKVCSNCSVRKHIDFSETGTLFLESNFFLKISSNVKDCKSSQMFTKSSMFFSSDLPQKEAHECTFAIGVFFADAQFFLQFLHV